MAERLSILQNFRPSLIKREPFPYFVIDGALPARLYEELERQYPSPDVIFSNRMRRRAEKEMLSNTRYDLPAAAVHSNPELDLGLWREFVLYHTSQEFLDEVLEKLDDFIALRYPWLLAKMTAKAPHGRPRAGIRRHNDHAESCELALDCQVGMNSRVTAKPSSVKGPHLDNSVELYAGLFYLRHRQDDSIGGDLQIYRWKNGNMSFYDKRSVRQEDAELVGVIPYAANRFALLLNGLDAIHGVSPRDITSYPRRLVNIIAEVYPTVDRLFDERPFKERTSALKKFLVRAGWAD